MSDVNQSPSLFFRTLIIAALVCAIGLIVYNKNGDDGKNSSQVRVDASSTTTVEVNITFPTPEVVASSINPAIPVSVARPKLLDLGADKCIPCKEMAPILEEMKVAYADRFEVEFIDVWKNEGEAGKYGVQMIPTQIFFDPQGVELFRHVGFFSKEDILAKWEELGYAFTLTPPLPVSEQESASE